MRAFFLAISAGTLSVALLPTLFMGLMALTLVPGVSSGDIPILFVVWMAILPFIVTAPLVLLGSLAIGLPVTAFLRWRGLESALAYIAAGSLGGSLLPLPMLAPLGVPSAYWLCLLGAISGGVTGSTWWACARRPDVRASMRRGGSG